MGSKIRRTVAAWAVSVLHPIASMEQSTKHGSSIAGCPIANTEQATQQDSHSTCQYQNVP
eukprot:2959154-Rhodomonas_salina.1